MQNDVNLTSPAAGRHLRDRRRRPRDLVYAATSATRRSGSTTTSADGHHLPAAQRVRPQRCPKGQGTPGGCTRDLVHRFYQEQYQLHGGSRNRYVTGSDAVGLTMGYYDTRTCRSTATCTAEAPHYVIADHFFQAAFGGSYLNHQYLVAAQPPLWSTARGQRALASSTAPGCRATTTRSTARRTRRRTSGDPGLRPADHRGGSGLRQLERQHVPARDAADRVVRSQDPLIDDTTLDLNIGDRLSDAGVSWAWYSGGWDNAAGNVTGRG
jgi:phospholipase C